MKVKWGLVSTLIITALFGGLAGSVFTWYVNRPRPTVLQYVITTTSIGADPNLISLVPDLQLRIGEENIQAFHTHTILLSVVGGQRTEEVDLAVQLEPDTRVFGIRTDAPSPLHKLGCVPETWGFRCLLGPLTPGPQAQFHIVLAVSRPVPPTLTTTSPSTRLAAFSDVPLSNAEIVSRTINPALFTASLAFFVLLLADFLPRLYLRITKRSTPED